MRFKEYQTLTEKQKEEYNYITRRRTHPIEHRFVIWTVVGSMLVLIIFMMTAYLIITEPVFAKYKQDIGIIFDGLFKALNIGYLIAIIGLVVEMIEMVVAMYKEAKFIKRIRGSKKSKKKLKN